MCDIMICLLNKEAMHVSSSPIVILYTVFADYIEIYKNLSRPSGAEKAVLHYSSKSLLLLEGVESCKTHRGHTACEVC